MSSSQHLRTFPLWSRKRLVAAATAAAAPTPVTSPNAETQILGNRVGKYDIRVTLEGKRSTWAPRWCIDSANPEVAGVLYFELQFQQPPTTPLGSATVVVSLGRKSLRNDPIPQVDTYAPKYGIEGPALSHTVRVDRRVDPAISLNAGLAGGGLSGLSRGRNVESTPEKKWMFTAGPPSCVGTRMTDVEFTWTRGWDDDFNATNRTFKTALLLHRPSTNELRVSVEVTATPLCRSRRASPAQEKTSDPILPIHNLESHEYTALRQQLEHSIRMANVEMSSFGAWFPGRGECERINTDIFA